MRLSAVFVAFATSLPLFAQRLTTPPRTADEPGDVPRIVEARKADDPELAPLLEQARAMAAKGADGAALLAAPALQPLREVDEFRRLVREHAPRGEVALAPPGEPGVPLRVEGAVRDSTGKALANALLYAYQTSAKGWYADRAPHFASEGARGGDVGHARLFGYVRTDDQGRFVWRTVRPGGYPRSTLPEHIHWQVAPAAHLDRDVAVGEVWFDDDPRLTDAMRKRAAAGASTVLVAPERRGDELVVRPVLVVDAARLESLPRK